MRIILLKQSKIMIITVFDTETTGFPPRGPLSQDNIDKWPYIVQLSWISYNVETLKLIEIKDYVIKLKRGILIPEESSKVHGITKDISIAQGINIKDALFEFLECLKNTNVLVAHNIEFDKKMIAAEFYRNGYHNIFKDMEYPFIEYCTMKFGDRITRLTRINPKTNLVYPKFPKLIELYEHLFKETPENLHNSLVDVMVCFRCFYYMYFGSDIVIKDESVKNKIYEVC